MSAQTGIAIAADFTADPIIDSLSFWCRHFGWMDEIRLAPYDQIIQALIDPAGIFRQSRGVNVILLRRHKLTPDFSGELSRAIESYLASGGAPLLIGLCPSPKQEGASAATPAEQDSVYVIQAEEIDRLYPVNPVFDPHAEALGDVPYTPQYFAALGTVLARRIHALRRKPYKVIALDCDDTLWRGTCGEDGPEGVVIDGPRRYLQEFMRTRRDAGMLLAIASKNNREDVLETFRVHPEMPLHFDDFVIDSIDWNSKGDGFTRMAKALNLGIDSFIFVDDNPKEIGEMHAVHPDVLGLALPHDEGRIPQFLDHVWAFDQLRVTQEDRDRNQNYRQQIERSEIEKSAEILGDFIEQLQVEVNLQPIKAGQVPRVAQLTQRTNQMNTTLVRRTEAEVGFMVGSEALLCITVDVADRFGSYGLVGALFLGMDADALRIDHMLLSCRALGRGVEHRMLRHAGETALSRGLGFVDVLFTEGPRNRPARQFLDSVASSENGVYRISANVCARLQYKPDARVQLIEDKPKSAALDGYVSRETLDYGRIARELSDPLQILQAIEAEHRKATSHLSANDPPRSDEERRIALIWADVLRISTPDRDVDFFDLGGHSLLAVQLLSRIRQELQVELPLDLIYTGKLTVASMAAAVELAQADPAEVDRLLAEIDNLSEDELRALLESE